MNRASFTRMIITGIAKNVFLLFRDVDDLKGRYPFQYSLESITGFVEESCLKSSQRAGNKALLFLFN